MIILTPDEDTIIDGTRFATANTAPTVTHADVAGQDLMTVGGTKLPELPDPAIGGQNGSRVLNGYSTGFRSMRQKLAAFAGGFLVAPEMQNPVVGNVGAQNKRTSRLRAGVLDQLTQYTPSQALYAPAYVGALTPPTVIRSE